jgi:hypothetical protein
VPDDGNYRIERWVATLPVTALSAGEHSLRIPPRRGRPRRRDRGQQGRLTLSILDES